MDAFTQGDASSNVRDIDKTKRLNQYIGAFVASLGGLALGCCLAWNANASVVLLRTFIEHQQGTQMDWVFVGAIVSLGSCFGIITVPIALKFFSRITTMFLTLPLLILGWALVCFGGRSAAAIIAGRFVCGFCGGPFCVITPIYVAEIAEKEIRGRLLCFFQLMINCGVMFCYTMANALNEKDSIWRFSLTCAMTSALIALVYLLPESPLYYLKRNDEKNARKAMVWYRGHAYNAEKELTEFRYLARAELSKVNTNTLRNLKIVRVFLVSLGIMLIQQLNGINLMMFFLVLLLETAGSGDMTVGELTLLVGTVQIISCIAAMLLIDVLGRRALLVISSAFISLFLSLLGWFLHEKETFPEVADDLAWMPPSWICLLFAAFNFGVGPVSWALLGEIYPAEIKLYASTIAAFSSWLLLFVVNLVFLKMLETVKIENIVWTFAGFCWAGTVFCAHFIEETKRKSLAQIQAEFETDPNLEENVVEET